MKLNKKGQIAGIILMIVSLFITLIAYVIVAPLMTPFLEGLNTDPFTAFLMLVIPFWLFLSIILGTVVSGRSA